VSDMNSGLWILPRPASSSAQQDASGEGGLQAACSVREAKPDDRLIRTAALRNLRAFGHRGPVQPYPLSAVQRSTNVCVHRGGQKEGGAGDEVASFQAPCMALALCVT